MIMTTQKEINQIRETVEFLELDLIDGNDWAKSEWDCLREICFAATDYVIFLEDRLADEEAYDEEDQYYADLNRGYAIDRR
jgi:hypothetical protein